MNKKQIAALAAGVIVCFAVTRLPWRMAMQQGEAVTQADGTIVRTAHAQFPAGELVAMIAVAVVAGFVFYRVRE